MEGKRITVIIPCYCSEKYLKRTVSEILAVLSGREGFRLTVVLINDASPDRTVMAIRELVDEYPGKVIGLDLGYNVGQARAKMAGLPYAEGSYAVFMDDDGQHDPRAIPDMIQKIERGFDLVYARFEGLEESAPRRAASSVLDAFLWVFDAKPRGLRITSFFALSPAAIECLQTYNCPHPFIGGYLTSKHFSVGTVPSKHRVRSMGKSGYSIRKLFMRAMELCLLWRLPVRVDEPMYTIKAKYEVG